MCGIAGLRTFGAASPDLGEVVAAMAARLQHRGPDFQGTWVDGPRGVALGHRRLSILDLTASGNQPMESASGRYVLVYNGEVYNFRQLRHELPAEWRGDSDTEVLLAAFERWGLEGALRRCLGMFALAVWDRQEECLTLARDRMGKKPLFFGWARETLLFGSELKALTAFPDFPARLDEEALALYLRYGYVPAPWCIYQGVRKLRPGHLCQVGRDRQVREWPYWDLRAHVQAGQAHPFPGTDQEAIEELHGLLRSAVELRLVADVPLGAFLSGGIDSSLIAALAQSVSSEPLRTFCIGFADSPLDEAPHAQKVADHLGTRHETLYVSDAQAQAVVPDLAQVCDEPLADSSLIPTFLVSRLARREVTVALSGDGGDELFFGYPRQRWSWNVWRGLRLVPRAWKPGLAALFDRLPPSWRRWRRLGQLLKLRNFTQLYRSSLSQWQTPLDLVRLGREPRTLMDEDLPGGPLEQMLLGDLSLYLADDILVKVDRASMAVSLEARAPLLDHRVVEWALRAPARLKLRHPQGKWILRQVLGRYVPPPLFERPKQGFGVPVEAWLRRALREWAEDLLSVERLRAQGLLQPEPIRASWARVLAGTEPHSYLIWNILSFQAWAARMPWS